MEEGVAGVGGQFTMNSLLVENEPSFFPCSTLLGQDLDSDRLFGRLVASDVNLAVFSYMQPAVNMVVCKGLGRISRNMRRDIREGRCWKAWRGQGNAGGRGIGRTCEYRIVHEGGGVLPKGGAGIINLANQDTERQPHAMGGDEVRDNLLNKKNA